MKYLYHILALLIAVATHIAFADDRSATTTTGYDTAREHYEWGRYEDSLHELQALLDTGVGSDEAGDVHMLMGRCLAQLGRDDEALLAYYASAYKYPDGEHTDDALLGLAGLQYQSGHVKALAETMQRLVDRYPASPHAAYAGTSAGWLYLQLDEHEKSVAVLRRVTKDYPNSTYIDAVNVALKSVNPTPPAPPPHVAPPSPPTSTAPADTTAGVPQGTPIVIHTPTDEDVELLAGAEPDPTNAMLHLRRSASGTLASRFEGQWIPVGTQGVYGKGIHLKTARREGNHVIWTFAHALPSGTEIGIYLRKDGGWIEHGRIRTE